jgi:aldehyde oxidoreductase
VLVDERPALACLKKAEQVAGRSVTTLEGIPEAQRQVLARAFVQEGAVQCGFCTPGIAMRAKTLLDRGTATDRDAVKKALAGHLCRCTGYTRIVDAITTAGEAWANGGAFASELPRRHEHFGAGGGTRRAPALTGAETKHGVGASPVRYRGAARVLGEQPFVADLRVPDMLHGAVVLAAHPRARVLAIDPSAAQAMPGVVRVLTAADVPGERFVGLVVRDWPVLVAVGEITRYVGDVLALVVADSALRARQAAQAVRVDYEVLTPVTSPEQALATDAPALHPSGNVLEVCAYARGDVDRALASAAHLVTSRFQTQRIEHAYLEPEACLAVPELADGGTRTLKVYTQGQGVHDDQAHVTFYY